MENLRILNGSIISVRYIMGMIEYIYRNMYLFIYVSGILINYKWILCQWILNVYFALISMCKSNLES